MQLSNKLANKTQTQEDASKNQMVNQSLNISRDEMEDSHTKKFITPKLVRGPDQIADPYAKKRFNQICNHNILVEGFDQLEEVQQTTPDVPTSNLIVTRTPNKSRIIISNMNFSDKQHDKKKVAQNKIQGENVYIRKYRCECCKGTWKKNELQQKFSM